MNYAGKIVIYPFVGVYGTMAANRADQQLCTLQTVAKGVDPIDIFLVKRFHIQTEPLEKLAPIRIFAAGAPLFYYFSLLAHVWCADRIP